MTTDADARYFFVHVMKTAGATFRQHVRANVPPGAFYPTRQTEVDVRAANYEIEYLLSLPVERKRQIRAYTGHFPFFVTDLVQGDFVTITMLRDPVDRVISYLKHAQMHHDRHRDWPLEKIYEDRFYFECFMWNHQVKIFAMTPGDRVSSYMDVIEIDDRRLEIAASSLDRVDVWGFTDRLGELHDELTARFGWRFGPVPDRRVAPPADVPPSLRRRIVRDNAADLEFHERARARYESRRRSGSRT